MSIFIAEMRNIDDGGGIISQKPDTCANRQGLHPLAQAQHGQGTEQPQSVDFKYVFTHVFALDQMFQIVHKLVTTCQMTPPEVSPIGEVCSESKS